MQLYYEKNRSKYLTAKTFDVTQYSSTSKEALMEVAKSNNYSK